jgi:outer membrane lipoprotein SlyB
MFEKQPGGRSVRPLAFVLVAGLLVAGCARSSTSTYEAVDVGRTIETAQGSVVSSRPVKIKGETSNVGPIAGGAVGAAGTGLAMGGRSGTGWAAILGAVVGAGIGYVAEQQMNNREGIEYIVQMDDGRTVTIVQNVEAAEQPLANGTPVLVQYSGKYTRVLPAPPRTTRKSGGGGWVDPDTIGAVGGIPRAPETTEDLDPAETDWQRQQ